MKPNQLNVSTYHKYVNHPNKMKKQRIECGFCDADWWNMDDYLIKLLPAMLRRLANKTIAYPGTEEFPTPESWTEYLESTAELFEHAELLTGDPTSEIGEAQHLIEEAFSRLAHVFFALWD